ncbi:MAG: hypothetical protein J6M02_04170 [Clostridia bacterium]|nr:hypothetical protein [Clostridia bacterium]
MNIPKSVQKLFLLFCLLLGLTSCQKQGPSKDIHEILLSIHHYACRFDVTFCSNKNTNTYTAIQEYNEDGSYYMEFLDSDELKIRYSDNILQLSSPLFPIEISYPYEELNQNPLFLSYFLNRYFNCEDSSVLSRTKSSVTLKMPDYNDYIDHATLTVENNLPKTLIYFDKNGTPKVNIIYSEFVSNSSC